MALALTVTDLGVQFLDSDDRADGARVRIAPDAPHIDPVEPAEAVVEGILPIGLQTAAMPPSDPWDHWQDENDNTPWWSAMQMGLHWGQSVSSAPGEDWVPEKPKRGTG